jgi:pimeloyl-ACP methyl ester carboxylesterase
MRTEPVPDWVIPPGATTQVINGYPMAYSSRGSGPTIVLVGGVLTDYRYWQSQQETWSSDYRVVAVSLRHFYPEKWTGKGSDFTIRQHAKDVTTFIESLNGPVYLVGWSYGAHVAYETAQARPELVRKLVLVEAPLDTLADPADRAGNSIRKDRATETAKFFDAGDLDGGLNFAIDAINGPGVWKSLPEAYKQPIRDNAWTVVGIGQQEADKVTCAGFGSLKMPVLLIQGERTTARFKELVAEEAKCLPQAQVATIPKAGHPSPSMNPPAFKEAVYNFLRH